MPQKNQELLDFLSKWGAFLTWILIGLIGKFGLDLISGRKFSYSYVLGSTGVAIFAGWLVYQWCLIHNTISPGIIVSIAALAGRDIALFFTMIDYKGVLQLITKKKVRKDE